MKISVAIITLNEERNIKRCLDSVVEIADEIIVVDSFSTDQTEKICTQYENLQFVKNEFKGHIEQKQFAVNQCSYNYVLSLDADEALTDKLKNSILEFKTNGKAKACSLNRLTNFCGQWIKHCGWYPDTKVRLWDRSIGHWGGVNPHDKVILDKNIKVEHLEGDLEHYAFYSIKQHLKQIDFFTDISSKAAFDQGKRSSILKMIVKPWFKFFRDYILKLGFLDGYYGYVICRNSAYAKYLKYLKLKELQKQK